jgi:hypothetical protein
MERQAFGLPIHLTMMLYRTLIFPTSFSFGSEEHSLTVSFCAIPLI